MDFHGIISDLDTPDQFSATFEIIGDDALLEMTSPKGPNCPTCGSPSE